MARLDRHRDYFGLANFRMTFRIEQDEHVLFRP
jgi:hypothetical protein